MAFAILVMAFWSQNLAIFSSVVVGFRGWMDPGGSWGFMVCYASRFKEMRLYSRRFLRWGSRMVCGGGD